MSLSSTWITTFGKPDAESLFAVGPVGAVVVVGGGAVVVVEDVVVGAVVEVVGPVGVVDGAWVVGGEDVLNGAVGEAPEVAVAALVSVVDSAVDVVSSSALVGLVVELSGPANTICGDPESPMGSRPSEATTTAAARSGSTDEISGTGRTPAMAALAVTAPAVTIVTRSRPIDSSGRKNGKSAMAARGPVDHRSLPRATFIKARTTLGSNWVPAWRATSLRASEWARLG